jgi:hypothetical protein
LGPAKTQWVFERAFVLAFPPSRSSSHRLAAVLQVLAPTKVRAVGFSLQSLAQNHHNHFQYGTNKVITIISTNLIVTISLF